MQAALQTPGDVGRLGQFLGLDGRWSYVDVRCDEAATAALARWALLRQLRELRSTDQAGDDPA